MIDNFSAKSVKEDPIGNAAGCSWLLLVVIIMGWPTLLGIGFLISVAFNAWMNH